MKSLSLPGPSGLGLLLALLAPVPAIWAQPGDSSWSDYGRGTHRGNRVQVMSANHIEADEKVSGDVVSVMGGNVVDGTVSHDVRAVMGNNVVNGSVGHDVITVMGETTINGTVGHNVSGTMGDITLGPNAVVRGDIINVGGSLHRDPGAIVRGRVINQAFNAHHRFEPDVTWRHESGMPDWMELVHDFIHAWKWAFALVGLALYALQALVFPGAIRRCGDVLVHRPGLTIGTAFLALLAVPLMFVLLLITIIGIPVAIFALPCALIAGMVFGKASIYALIGRSLSRDRLHPAAAVLVGGGLCVLLYFASYLGLILSALLSVLGLGCVLAALLTSRGPAPVASEPFRPAPSAPTPVIPAPPLPMEGGPVLAAATPAPVTAAPALPAGLPRAGFWIRIGALCIDGLIVSAIFGDAVWNNHVIHEGFHISGSNCLLPLAIYAALMWKFKGTTIGGMICGLRVVRLDDTPVGWETAIVRALGCFLSAFFALGFFWIALDPEKQAWHDKIAGTVVVRTKGVSLV
jgi:uncharacterized RDD family membrane protein YckC